MLGLANAARALVNGETLIKSISANKVELVLIANDASDNTKKKITDKYKDSIVKLLKKKKLIEDLTLDELLTRYNLNYKDKGLTKFFDKLSEVDKRTILIDSLKNNILANKTSLYLGLYKASKHGVKKNKKASTKNKVKKNKKK